MDMAKKICIKTSIRDGWSTISINTFKRWVIHNLLIFFTFKVKGVVHTKLPQKENKKTITIIKVNVGLMRIYLNCQGHEKLQEQKLSQGHNKENKS
jgi:hypothetical protein